MDLQTIDRAVPHLTPAELAEIERLAPVAGYSLAPEERPHIPLRQHLEEVDPGPHLEWWHVGAMIEACQAFLDGEIRRLLLAAPPRTWKSRITIQGGASCAMRNWPDEKIMTSCASDDLVLYHSGHVRTAFLEACGPDALLGHSKAIETWQTREHGVYKSATVGGARLGFGWGLGFVDDPFTSRAMALSQRQQAKVWAWWRDDFLTRKQTRVTGQPPGVLLMHQRLAIGDLAGRLLEWLEEESAEAWHALILRGYSEAKPYSLPACVTPLPDPRQGEDVPLCDDPGVMREIEQRRKTNPPLHQAVDQQDPPETVPGANIWTWRPEALFEDDDPDLLAWLRQGKAVRLFGMWDYGRAKHGLCWILGALQPGAPPVLWIIGARVWTGADYRQAARDRAAFLDTLDLPITTGRVQDFGDPAGWARDSTDGWAKNLRSEGVPLIDLRHTTTEGRDELGRKRKRATYWNNPEGFLLSTELVQSWLDSGRLRVRNHPSTRPVVEAVKRWQLDVPEGVDPMDANRQYLGPHKGRHSHPGDALRYGVAGVAQVLKAEISEETEPSPLAERARQEQALLAGRGTIAGYGGL